MPNWQAAVEGAQVLSGVVSYPPHNSFHIYHVKLWTILNQLLVLPLALGSSERALSILVSGGIAALSFVAMGLCTFAVSRDAFWGIASPFLVHFSGLREVLAVNYPMDFMGTPHTYGVVGLAWSVTTLSLFVLGRYSIAGLFLGLAPAIHPSMGVWCWFITAAVLLWHGGDSFNILRKLWRPTAAGLTISLASFILQLMWMAPVVPRVDAATQAGFVSAWVDFFDVHRRAVDFSLPGVQVTMAAVVIGLYLIPFLDEDDAASLLLLKTIVAASIFALMGAGVSLLPPSTVPPMLLTLMPTRLFLLSNLLFVTALVGLLSRFQSIWVRINALLLALALAIGDARLAMYSVVLSGVGFMIWKSVSLADRVTPLARISRWIPALAGAVVLVLSIQGISDQLRTARAYLEAMVDRTNSPVLTLASTTNGLIAIDTQCCPFTQLRTRRPLLIETMALDQIMYAPESAPDMNTALKAVYGVDLLHPAAILRGSGEDLTPVTKPLWEGRSSEEWKRLASAFGFTTILTNPSWTLHLPEVARDPVYVLYRIP